MTFRAECTFLLQEMFTFFGWNQVRVRMSWMKNIFNFAAILIIEWLLWSSIIYLLIVISLIWRIIIKILRCHRWAISILSIKMPIVWELCVIQLPLRLMLRMFQKLFVLLLAFLLWFLPLILFWFLMAWIRFVCKVVLIHNVAQIFHVLWLIMKALRISCICPCWCLLIVRMSLIKLVSMSFLIFILRITLCKKILLIRPKNMARRYRKHSARSYTLILCFVTSLILNLLMLRICLVVSDFRRIIVFLLGKFKETVFRY